MKNNFLVKHTTLLCIIFYGIAGVGGSKGTVDEKHKSMLSDTASEVSLADRETGIQHSAIDLYSAVNESASESANGSDLMTFTCKIRKMNLVKIAIACAGVSAVSVAVPLLVMYLHHKTSPTSDSTLDYLPVTVFSSVASGILNPFESYMTCDGTVAYKPGQELNTLAGYVLSPSFTAPAQVMRVFGNITLDHAVSLFNALGPKIQHNIVINLMTLVLMANTTDTLIYMWQLYQKFVTLFAVRYFEKDQTCQTYTFYKECVFAPACNCTDIIDNQTKQICAPQLPGEFYDMRLAKLAEKAQVALPLDLITHTKTLVGSGSKSLQGTMSDSVSLSNEATETLSPKQSLSQTMSLSKTLPVSVSNSVSMTDSYTDRIIKDSHTHSQSFVVSSTHSASLSASNQFWKHVQYQPYQAGNVPSARYLQSAIIDNNRTVWMFGGISSSGSSIAEMWSYSMNMNAWNYIQQGAIWPAARNSAGMVYDGENAIWMFAGTPNTNSYSNALWKFDIPSLTWTQIMQDNINSYPQARYSFGIVIDANKNIWVFGGSCGGGPLCSNPRNFGSYLNDLIQYSTVSGGAWQTITSNGASSSPAKRYQHAMAIDANQRIWIFGGQAYPGGAVNDLWSFATIGSRQWIQVIPNNPAGSPMPRSQHTLISDNDNNLYLFGGYGYLLSPPSYIYLNDFWKFNTIIGTKWQQINGNTTMGGPQPRYGHSMMIDITGRIYILAGIGTMFIEGGLASLTMNNMWMYETK